MLENQAAGKGSSRGRPSGWLRTKRTHRLRKQLGPADLTRALAASPAPTMITALDGRILVASHSMATLLETDVVSLEGGLVPEALPAEAAETLAILVAQALHARQTQSAEVALSAEEPSSSRWIRFSVSPLPDEHGDASASIVVATEVTAMRRAALERRRLDEQALSTRKLDSLGDLASGIAHDFNNLLMVILGHASLALLRTPEESRVRTNLEQVEHAALRAAALTSQLLDFAGRSAGVYREVDVNARVRNLQRDMQESSQGETAVDLTLADDLSPVLGDAEQIEQIIRDLVANAAEAGPGGKGVVQVTTGMMIADQAYLDDTVIVSGRRPGAYVYFEVADRGVGMDAATLERIFDPFFSTKFAGRGLGLAAVLGLVRSHGGTLRVESQPGAGSKFRVLLPCSNVSAERPRPASFRTTRRKLLVLESTHRTISAENLAARGYELLFARDAHHASRLLSEQRDEILAAILDGATPPSSAQSIALDLHRDCHQLPILACAGGDRDLRDQLADTPGIAGALGGASVDEDLVEMLAAMSRSEEVEALRPREPKPAR